MSEFKTATLWKLDRTCLSKKSFSKKDADTSIEYFATQGKLIFYYKCTLCSRYHLTSKEPRAYNDAEHYKII